MKNKNRFIKKWNAIPGLSAKNTQYFIEIEKRRESLQNEDQENRRYVRNKIKQYIELGMQQKEIVEKILNDSIMEKFEYLTRNGLDIKLCVTDWVQSTVKRQNVKTEKER